MTIKKAEWRQIQQQQQLRQNTPQQHNFTHITEASATNTCSATKVNRLKNIETFAVFSIKSTLTQRRYVFNKARMARDNCLQLHTPHNMLFIHVSMLSSTLYNLLRPWCILYIIREIGSYLNFVQYTRVFSCAEACGWMLCLYRVPIRSEYSRKTTNQGKYTKKLQNFTDLS